MSRYKVLYGKLKKSIQAAYYLQLTPLVSRGVFWRSSRLVVSS